MKIHCPHLQREYSWKNLENGADQLCRVKETAAGGVIVTGIVQSAEGRRCCFSLSINEDVFPYRFICETDGSVFTMLRGASVSWNNPLGHRFERLDDYGDIDLSDSPITNTIPVRRMLKLGLSSIKIKAVHILEIGAISMSTMRPAHQQYQVLDAHGDLVRYTNLESGYTADIPLDDLCVPITYPGIFEASPISDDMRPDLDKFESSLKHSHVAI